MEHSFVEEVVEIESDDEDEKLAKALRESAEDGACPEAVMNGHMQDSAEKGQGLDPKEVEGQPPQVLLT